MNCQINRFSSYISYKIDPLTGSDHFSKDHFITSETVGLA